MNMVKRNEILKNKKEACACKTKGKAECSCTKKTGDKKMSVLIKCDIGWGNTLFIRGEGNVLNWDKGIALSFCEKGQGWFFETEGTQPIEFKVLINDQQWSAGDNLKLIPGKHSTMNVSFES